jgi:hypothetical protein
VCPVCLNDDLSTNGKMASWESSHLIGDEKPSRKLTSHALPNNSVAQDSQKCSTFTNGRDADRQNFTFYRVCAFKQSPSEFIASVHVIHCFSVISCCALWYELERKIEYLQIFLYVQ